MSLHLRARSPTVALLVLSIVLITFLAVQPVPATHGERGPVTIASIEPLGVVTFPTGTEFAGTEVGRLSGITFDPHRNVYYVVSDDGDNPRFYTVAIDFTDGRLDEGDVTFLDVTVLQDQNNPIGWFKSHLCSFSILQSN